MRAESTPIPADGNAGVVKPIILDEARHRDLHQQRWAVSGETVHDPRRQGQHTALLKALPSPIHHEVQRAFEQVERLVLGPVTM